ncbi:MAG: PAS domain-containing protein [Myxococcales bacterium]|nr:PAS domain-containing protein [Myxococcales bacterium]
MIQRVRSRLYLLSLALAAVATLTAAVVSTHGLDVDSLSGFAWVGLLVLAVALVSGLVTLTLVRRSMREVADQTRNVVRDTSRRVSLLDVEAGDELRQLAEWVNFLAEDADRSHTALARERVLLSSVAEGITQGVIAVDGEHRIELLNDAARRMLGVQSTPVGELLIEFVRVPAVFELIEGNDAATVEIQLPTGRRALLRVANRWGGQGRVLLLEDVTTVRKLENVRRDFVANVSHELRTPVAVIRANAETLLAGAAADPVMGPKLIDGLHRNAERLARIIADLLDLSRLDAGQYRLELARVPVKAITEQALTGVEPQATARGVTIDVQVPDELAVMADPKALDQILVNLLDNAVKYTKATGHVWVATKDEGSHVRIEVRDDGPGIADKHRERVFERFYRADSSRSREAGGTGLGLSIVKHLTESMGGSVGVEPGSPSGTTFWLKLPRSHT